MNKAQELIRDIGETTKSVFEDSKSSSRKFQNDLMNDVVKMFNTGMSVKDIVQNVNHILEPVVGFTAALDVSDKFNRVLMTLKGKEEIDRKELDAATIKVLKKK